MKQTDFLLNPGLATILEKKNAELKLDVLRLKIHLGW